MRRLIIFVPVLCLLTGTAFAAGVTLRYRMDPSNGPPFYVMGQSVKFAAAPAGSSARLPKCRSRKPLVGHARLGRGGNTDFLFALDESAGTGKGYDRLYVDTNHNGSLKDETAVKLLRRRWEKSFGPFRLLVPVDGRKVLYHARMQTYQGRPQQVYTLQALGYYTGTAPFGDRKYRVSLIDCNCNGLYGDPMKGYFDEGGMGDILLVDVNGNGEYDSDSMFPKEVCFTGKRIALEGKYYDTRISADGSSLAVAPTTAPLGTLRADFASFMLMLAGSDGVFPVESSTGAAQLPKGSYHTVAWSITRKGKNDEKWQMQVATEGKDSKGVPLTVGDTECAFAPDLTITARPRASVEANGQVQFSMEFGTAGGLRLANIGANGKRPLEPTLKVLDEKGAEVANLKLEYG